MHTRFLGVANVTHPLVQMGKRQTIQTRRWGSGRHVFHGKKCPNDLLIGLLANLPSGFHGGGWLERRRTPVSQCFPLGSSPSYTGQMSPEPQGELFLGQSPQMFLLTGFTPISWARGGTDLRIKLKRASEVFTNGMRQG